MCWCRIGSYQLDSGIIKSDSALTVLSRSSLYKHPQSTCQLLQQLAGRSPDCTCISTNTRLIISFGGIKGPNGSLKALIYILKGLNPPAAAELCLQKLHMHCSWFLVTLCVNSFFFFSGLGTLSTEGGFFMWFFFLLKCDLKHMFPRTQTCVSWCLDVYLLYKWESLQGGRGGVVYLTVLTRCLQMEISCRAVRKAWCWARGGWGHWVRTVVQLRGSSFGFRLLLPESIKAVQQQQWPVTPWEAVSLWGSCVCLFVVVHRKSFITVT